MVGPTLTQTVRCSIIEPIQLCIAGITWRSCNAFLIEVSTGPYHRAKFHADRCHRRRDICNWAAVYTGSTRPDCNWTTNFRSQRTSHMEPSATSTTVTGPVGERLQADIEDALVLDRPAPLRRLHDSDPGYKYTDLLTYLITATNISFYTNVWRLIDVLLCVYPRLRPRELSITALSCGRSLRSINLFVIAVCPSLMCSEVTVDSV